MSFDNVDVAPEVSSKVVKSYATEIVEAFKSSLITDPSKNRLTPMAVGMITTEKLDLEVYFEMSLELGRWDTLDA